MYTVVGHPRSRAMRLIWMLEELGQPYEIEPAAPQSERARALNPLGKIPALVIDGEALIDSSAILQFLADRHGALTFPAGSLERARQDAHLHFALDEIEGALWTAAKHLKILPEDRRVPAVAPACKQEFDVAMSRLADRIGEGPWLMGEAFTVPDVLVGHCLTWGEKAMGWPLPPGDVVDYAARLRARPAFLRAGERAKEAAEAA
ncbi:MAG TPA: glutathione S-transferase family protein [Paracoccaceae bacterium]|nr:glutathione S-transferase family protein [Paracoccaceae bacterium]